MELKKVISCLLALCLAVITGLPALGRVADVKGELVRDAKSGLIFKKLVNPETGEKEAWLLDDGGAEGDLVVPGEIDGYPVTRLFIDKLGSFVETMDGRLIDGLTEPGAVYRTDGFSGCMAFSITFPGSMRNFEKMEEGDVYAFNWCRNLKKVVFLEGVEELNEGFAKCALREVYLPASIRELSHAEFAAAEEGFTIYAPEGSYAQQYAEQYGYAFIPENRAPFWDTAGHWAREAVDWASGEGLVFGTSPSTFSPNAPVTQAMLFTILYRQDLLKFKDEGGWSATAAGDLPYYEKSRLWASLHQLTDCLDSGDFQADTPVSREELAQVLLRYLVDLDEVTPEMADLTGFTDTGEASEAGVEALGWAVAIGIMSGKGNGRLDPKGTTTRAELVTVLKNLEDSLGKTELS